MGTTVKNFVRKTAVRDADSRTEILFSDGDAEAFLTVARLGDHEDEDRVATLTPTQALKIAAELQRFAYGYLSRADGEDPP